MNEKFIQRLSDILQERGMKQADLAKLTGIRPSSISDWLTGKYIPKQDKIDVIAKALSVSPAWLLGYGDISTVSNTTPIHHKKIARIPLLGRVAAGIPIEAIENIEDYEEMYIPVSEDPHDYFALRIVGHSMEPRIWDGDIVIVRKQDDADNGKIAVVLVNGNDATVKQIKKSDSGITLIGMNPAVYAPHFYTAEEVIQLPVRILGVVCEVRGKI